MTDLAELVADCDSRGIRLFPSGDGGLAIDAPEDTLTPELLARLKAQKAALLAMILGLTPNAVSPPQPPVVAGVTTPVAIQAVSGPGGRLALVCPSAELAARIEAGRPALETLLAELAAEAEAAGDDVLPWEEPPETDWTCADCGGFLWWEDVKGGRHCVDCGREKLARSLELAERAARLRARCTPKKIGGHKPGAQLAAALPL